MSVGSELEKLNELRFNGVLTDAEFSVAKSSLLGEISREGTVDSGVHLMGKAASKFVNLKIAAFLVGTIITAVFFFAFFMPQWYKFDRAFDESRTKQKQFDKEYEKSSKEMEDFKKKNGFK